MSPEFRLTHEHLVLVRHLNIEEPFGQRDGWAYPPQVSNKRPFGNGDAAADVIRILKWSVPPGKDDEIRDQAVLKVRELAAALQIVCCQAGCDTIRPGLYERMHEADSRSWYRKGD